jgi:hypothetical protein
MPTSPLIEELAAEYRTLDDVQRSLQCLEKRFYEAHDRRAIFASTLSLAAASDQSPSLTIATSNLYRSALLAYEKGDSALPKSWKIALDAARHEEALLIQDLFLGINAHVNRDWPIALGSRPDRQAYLSMSQALATATAQIEARIEKTYGPTLRVLGRAFQPVAKDITSFDLAKACQLAWENAWTTSAAGNAEHLSAVLARLILAPSARKLVLDALRKIESVTPWWRYLAPPKQSQAVDQPPAAGTLDELIARLRSVAQQFEARSSRLSVDAATHAEFYAKIKDALASDAFTDPAGINTLMLHHGSLYLNTAAAFERGNVGDIPDCWFMAFRMAATGDNLLLQDVLAALNAHYNHDLPIAVAKSGSLNQPDLEKFQAMYRDHIIELEQSIVNRYAEAPIFPNLLTGPLQGILAEFPFDRALAQPPPDACAITQRILLKGLPGASWVIHALRHIESEWNRPPGRC